MFGRHVHLRLVDSVCRAYRAVVHVYLPCFVYYVGKKSGRAVVLGILALVRPPAGVSPGYRLRSVENSHTFSFSRYPMSFLKLEGLHAFCTGAAGGIGSAIVDELLGM